MFTPEKAEVRLLNLSPNRIFTRGVFYIARWTNSEHHLEFSDYNPGRGLPPNPAGMIPAQPSNSLQDRDAEWVEGGDSIVFTRTYTNLRWDSAYNADGITALFLGAPPITWVQYIDWWFADSVVRQHCGQKNENGGGYGIEANSPETTTGSPPPALSPGSRRSSASPHQSPTAPS